MDSHRGRVEWRRRSDSPAHGGRQHSCDGERHEQASSALQAADGANAANIAIAIAYAAAAVAADDRDAVGRRFRCGASVREALERRVQATTMNAADEKRPNVLVNEGVSLEGAYRANAN